MIFEKKLLEGNLISRYKRFFADVEYINEKNKNEKVTIHVPNTGSLKTVIDKESTVAQKCWFSLHGDPTKKLKGTLEAVKSSTQHWVGVNTSNPNKIVYEAIEKSFEKNKPFLDHWSEYKGFKPEYKISKETRLDGVLVFNLEDLNNEKSKKHFFEIKNTTYRSEINGIAHAQFPDAVTERGQKHIEEMMKLIQQGHRCEIIFTVQRDDVQVFSPCDNIDPKYGQLLRQAIKMGLIVTPLLVEINQNQIVLTNKKLKVIT